MSEEDKLFADFLTSSSSRVEQLSKDIQKSKEEYDKKMRKALATV